VDDILIFSKNMEMVDQAKDMLVEHFKMHEEDMSKYQGINVSRGPGMAKLSLPLYVNKIQGRYKIPETSRAILVPMILDPNSEQPKEDGQRTPEIIEEF